MTDIECYRRIVAVQLRALVEIGETVKDDPTVQALHDALDVIDPLPEPDDSGIRWHGHRATGGARLERLNGRHGADYARCQGRFACLGDFFGDFFRPVRFAQCLQGFSA